MLSKQIRQSSKSKVRLRKREPQLRQYERAQGHSWEETQFAVIVPEASPIYQEALDYYLKGNPFLHTLDSDYEINNIEEYYCFYKGEYILMSDLIRSGQYSKFRQRRILKKNFKEWNKDYSKDKHETIKVVESTFTMIGELDFKIFGLIKRFLLFTSFFFCISIIYNKNNLLSRLFGSKLGSKVLEGLNNFFSNYTWSITFLNITLYSTIAGILYLKLVDTILIDYESNYDNARKILGNSKNIMNQEFKKKTRRARKYYLNKVLKKPSKNSPLKIESVCQTKVNLKKFNLISNNVVVKGAKVKKSIVFFNVFKYLLLSLSYSGLCGLIVLLIFQLVKGIFL